MGFYEVRAGELLCYKSDTLEVNHGFTTRLGGVSQGHLASMNLGIRRGDTPEAIDKNFAILSDALGFDPGKSVFSVQVHKDEIRTVTEADWGKGLITNTDYECDGMITDLPGTSLFVFSADCGTLLYHDPVTGVVGACHAGWRGTALGIARRTVEKMVEVYGCDPKNIKVVLGPCISQCCFETDADVPNAMLAALGEDARPAIREKGEKYHVDLKAINRTFLLKAGILPENIDVTELCTACQPDVFWSHRRHGDKRGSLGAMIVCGGSL